MNREWPPGAKAGRSYCIHEYTWFMSMKEFDTVEAREYCAPNYDRERFVPVRYGIPRLYNRGIDWYQFN